VLAPAAAVPARTAGWLIAAAGVLALAVVLSRVLPDVTGLSRRSVLPVAVVLALGTEPVRQTLGFGQVNLLLMALVAMDLLRRDPSRWAGVGVGIATAIKLTPGLFIVYLLVTRQWRTARTATLTVAALTGCGFLLAPAESARYFGDLMWQTGRVGAADALTNQSLSGLLARLAGTAAAPAGWWLALVSLVLVAGLRRARAAHADGAELTAVTLVALTANLISPMSWTHHLVFLPIAVLLLADLARRRRDVGHAVAAVVVYALSVVSPIWLRPESIVAENAYVLMLLVLVITLPWQHDEAQRQPGPPRRRCTGGRVPDRLRVPGCR
jgi:hypothetical protein